MPRDEPPATYSGYVVHQTEKAVLFYCEDLDEEIWFPLSQCDLDGDETMISVPMWLVREKGLE